MMDEAENEAFDQLAEFLRRFDENCDESDNLTNNDDNDNKNEEKENNNNNNNDKIDLDDEKKDCVDGGTTNVDDISKTQSEKQNEKQSEKQSKTQNEKQNEK